MPTFIQCLGIPVRFLCAAVCLILLAFPDVLSVLFLGRLSRNTAFTHSIWRDTWHEVLYGIGSCDA